MSVFAALVLSDRIHMRAFAHLALRSAPLVQAIKEYETRYGSPPPTLQSLVPDFLPTIPSTQMASCPAYQYHMGDKAASFDGYPWMLLVTASNGLMDWDRFIYLPLQNYPTDRYGGSLQRIHDWAYVHE